MEVKRIKSLVSEKDLSIAVDYFQIDKHITEKILLHFFTVNSVFCDVTQESKTLILNADKNNWKYAKYSNYTNFDLKNYFKCTKKMMKKFAVFLNDWKTEEKLFFDQKTFFSHDDLVCIENSQLFKIIVIPRDIAK